MSDDIDIVKRLRNWGQRMSKQNHEDALEAAAEIERLRAALRAIRDEIIYGGSDLNDGPDIDKMHDIARAAIARGEKTTSPLEQQAEQEE